MKKWQKLAELIHSETAILADRNTPEELMKLHEEGHAFICEINDEIVAYAALFPTNNKNWVELGSVFVRKDHRGEKMSSELFSKCLSGIDAGLHILVVTHHPKVIHLCEKFGLNELLPSTKTEAPPHNIICGPCDSVPETEKANCPHRYKRNACAAFFT